MGTHQIDFDRIIERQGTHSEKWDARLVRFGRKDVLPVWVADMDFASPSAVTEALLARAQSPIYGYTQVHEGIYQSLINWMQQQFQWAIAREQILLAPGVIASFRVIIQALTQIGDSIIIQTPVYAAFQHTIQSQQRNTIENPLELTEEGGLFTYRMNLSHLEACAQQGAKMLVLCSPHNPVGRVWQLEELAAVLDIARRYQLIIFSDEIHGDLIYPEYQHIPLGSVSLASDRIISALGPGKTFNLSGLGLSAVVTAHTGMLDQLVSWFAGSASQTHNPFSLTAFEAGYRHGVGWRDALMIYLRDTREQVIHYFSRYWPLVRVIAPQGTILMWLDCRAYGLNDEALNRLFIDQHGLGMSAGIQFGQVGSGFMRLNLAMPRQLLLAKLGGAH